MPKGAYGTSEQMEKDTIRILNDMRDYFATYYGPRCEEHEPGCPVCEVWKLYDSLKVWIA